MEFFHEINYYKSYYKQKYLVLLVGYWRFLMLMAQSAH
jgi:hypothetical protein